MKKIKLTKNKYAMVDDEDYPYLSRFNWITNGKGGKFYAGKIIQRNEKQISVYMYEFLINCVNFECITFKNGNSLDYRKKNIAIVPYSVRLTRAKKRKNTSSKYKGLTYRKKTKMYDVRIFKDKKAYYLGTFKNEKKAAQAYNDKAIELYGEFAYLNKI